MRADAMIAWFQDYAATRLNSRLIDERRTIPPYVLLDLAEQGFMGLQVGDHALTNADLVRLFEAVGAVDPTIALLLGLHNGLGMRTIQAHGSTALRERWMPLLASGRQLAAFALSEPGAGSNPAAIQATARKVDGGWRVDAHKHWIGLGSWAGILTVFARAIDAEGKGQRLIALAVPAEARGLTIGREAVTMGVRGLPQTEVFLRDVFVPDDHVLGKPGGGMLVAQDAMMISRLGIASICVGTMKRAAQLVARYVARREVATGRLADNAVTRLALDDIAGACEAGSALVTYVAGLEDAAPKQAYVACKAVLPELLWEVLDRATQLLGGRGYMEPNELPRLLRDARALRVFEGPTETLLVHLGGSLMKRPQALAELITGPFGLEGLRGETEGLAEAILRHNAAMPEAWTAYHLGNYATQAMLLAATIRMGRPDAEAWALARYEHAVRRALDHRQTLPGAEEVLGRIAGFAATIGDLDQALPGEAEGLDPWLQR